MSWIKKTGFISKESFLKDYEYFYEKYDEQHHSIWLPMNQNNLRYQPRLQHGPCCGFIALACAFHLDNGTLSSYIHYCKEQKFTAEGELFDPESILAVLQHFSPSLPFKNYGCEKNLTALELIRTLSLGNVILYPYDADGNHSPANKNGLSPHWCCLFGFSIISPIIPEKKGWKECCTEWKDRLFWFSSLEFIHEDSLKDCTVYFFGYQGKSLHVQIWEAQSLIASNAQLSLNPVLVEKYPNSIFSNHLHHSCIVLS